ncbi:MAG: ComF family protein [Chloroflexaceae bacterium]|nr:ComF family protein [Chloroflexaceae bacterium]
MALSLQSLTDGLLGLLFPDRCAGCGQVGSLLCAGCLARLQPYQAAMPRHQPVLDAIGVAFLFDAPLREAIHQLKYERARRMAAPLAALLHEYLQRQPLPADVLIPVPLHPRRFAERGFNQSELLANHLAASLRLPVLITGLVRQRNTATQVGLNMQQRQQNVQDAFLWQARVPPPPRVLLLDDVFTTGATMLACAAALRRAGAREVRALALGRSHHE